MCLCLLLVCKVFVITGAHHTILHSDTEHPIFKKKDIAANIKYLDNVQQLIGKVQTVIDKNNLKQYNINDKGVETFSDFIQNVFAILNKYENKDLEEFITIFNDEVKKYHYRGCKFYELTENLVFRKLIAALLDAVRNKPAETVKRISNELADKMEDVIYDRNGRKLITLVNSLYGPESKKTFKEFLTNVDSYRLKTRKDVDLALIIREGIRSILFDHYTRLNLSTRRALKSILNDCKRTFRDIMYTLITITDNEDIDLITTTVGSIRKTTDYDTSQEATMYFVNRKLTQKTTRTIKDIVKTNLEVKSKVKDLTTKMLRPRVVSGVPKFKYEIYLPTPARRSNRTHKRRSVNWLTLPMLRLPTKVIYLDTKERRHSKRHENTPNDKTRPIGRVRKHHQHTTNIKNKKLFTRSGVSSTISTSVIYNTSRIQWLEKELKAIESQKNKYAEIIQDLERRVQEREKEHEELMRIKESVVSKVNGSDQNYIKGQWQLKIINMDNNNDNQKLFGEFRDGRSNLQGNQKNKDKSKSLTDINHSLDLSNFNNNEDSLSNDEDENKNNNFENAKTEFHDRGFDHEYKYNNNKAKTEKDLKSIQEYINKMKHEGDKSTERSVMVWPSNDRSRENGEDSFDSSKQGPERRRMNEHTEREKNYYFRRNLDGNAVTKQRNKENISAQQNIKKAQNSRLFDKNIFDKNERKSIFVRKQLKKDSEEELNTKYLDKDLT